MGRGVPRTLLRLRRRPVNRQNAAPALDGKYSAPEAARKSHSDVAAGSRRLSWRARLRQANRLVADAGTPLSAESIMTIEPEDILASRVFGVANGISKPAG